MKSKKSVTFASLALAAAAGFLLVRPASGAEGDAAGVRKGCEAIVMGWNAHDAKAMAAVFAEDADMVGPDGTLHSGRAAIEKAFAEDHSGVMKKSQLTVLKEPVRFPTPDVAVSDAEVEIKGIVAPDGSEAPPMKLVVTNVWKRADGKWWVFASRPHVLMSK